MRINYIPKDYKPYICFYYEYEDSTTGDILFGHKKYKIDKLKKEFIKEFGRLPVAMDVWTGKDSHNEWMEKFKKIRDEYNDKLRNSIGYNEKDNWDSEINITAFISWLIKERDFINIGNAEQIYFNYT